MDIAYADVEAVRNADAIFACINGVLQMKGLLSNLGRCCFGKTNFLFRDDFRKCADSNTFPCNLMLYAGLQKKVGKDIFMTPLIRLRIHESTIYMDCQ